MTYNGEVGCIIRISKIGNGSIIYTINSTEN